MKKVDSGVSLRSAVTSSQGFARQDGSNQRRGKLRLVKNAESLVEVPLEERLQQQPPILALKQGLKRLGKRSAQLVKESPTCPCSWCACKLLMDSIKEKPCESI